MTESEILNNLEFVTDRLLELKEWDCSKKIEQIKNYILQKGLIEDRIVSFEEVPPTHTQHEKQIHSFLFAAG